MLQPTQEQVDALKAEHGDKVYALDLDEPEARILFRRPSKLVWDTFADSIQKDSESRARATDEFVTRCLLFPDRDVWRQLVAEYPGVSTSVGRAMQETIGLDTKKKPVKI
jgi:hypothetical protein